MFQFTPLAPQRLCIHPRGDTVFPYRVSPFGDLRINACVQLTEAYRSLPRPSSPIDAKASTIRPYQLNQKSLQAKMPVCFTLILLSKNVLEIPASYYQWR
jgi:hypothetical protein